MQEYAEVIKSKCDENVRIFSDEIYEDIIYDNLKLNSIASIKGMEKLGKTIFLNIKIVLMKTKSNEFL